VWAWREDFTPTFEQIERGLTAVEWGIRNTWTERIDFTPTPEQVERGLTDHDSDIRSAWIKRLRMDTDSVLEDEDQVICTL
jgi:hypothetical protein